MKKLRQYQFKNISASVGLYLIAASVILFSIVYFYCQYFLEPKAYDFLINLTATKKTSKDIVAVVIDDQSLNKIGRWPWDRNSYADIFEYLEIHGKVKAIAFDSVIISEDEKQNDERYFKRISKLNKLVQGVFFSKQKEYFVHEDEKDLKEILKDKFTIKVADYRKPEIIKSNEYLSSSFTLPELMESLNSVGSVLSYQDKDGVIRKTEPVFYFNNSYYPSLALAVMSKISNNKEFQIDNSSLKMHNDNSKLKVPLKVSKKGSFNYIKWYKPENKDEYSAYKSYSAWKIIKSYEQINKKEAPVINPAIFKDKIVIVGVTSTALKDIKTTPLDKDYPGVYIQATNIDNLLNNDFIKKPDRSLNLIILGLILALTFSAILFMPPVLSSVAIPILMLGYFQVCFFSYSRDFAIDVITPQVFIICSLIIGYGYKYFSEEKEKKQIKSLMAKYVSKEVMADILNHVDKAQLGGKKSEITVLFADIRGFTSISETLEPEMVSSILSDYFSEMVPIILKHKGMLNKFMGDALLAVFGAPIENPEHSRLAIMCAMEMLEKVKELQKKWNAEGKPKIKIGIGINTGIAFVGNIGSEDRMEYTVIGDTVNIANRLESFNKIYNSSLIISSSTYEKVKDTVDVIKVSSVTIKGRSEPIDIFEVTGLL